MRILFACERSAGHIFPALSIADKIRQSSQLSGFEDSKEIYFFLSSGFLKKYVQSQGYLTFGKYFRFRCLPIEGFWRFFEAIYIILRLRPQKVIGFGGRDSFFLILFSSLLSIETTLYELNFSLGRANKVLSRFAKKVVCGFQEGVFLEKAVFAGVPLRKNLKKLSKSAARKELGFDRQPVVFCCGGSQGSSFVNQVFLNFIEKFKGACQVIHLTGKDKFLEISQKYNKIEHKSFVRDFYYNVELLYSAADLVVSRAGASSLAEISYYQLAAVLLPHPGGSGHQVENARYFQKNGAVLLCLEDDFSFQNFSCLLESLITDENLRSNLADNAAAIKLGVGFEDLDLSPYC